MSQILSLFFIDLKLKCILSLSESAKNRGMWESRFSLELSAIYSKRFMCPCCFSLCYTVAFWSSFSCFPPTSILTP